MYRILLVDDEPLILAGITSLLNWEQLGCEIVGKAVNGQRALEQMEELCPDLVITDIRMPGMDGITLMKQAKERWSHMEFILLTNLEEFSLVREAMQMEAVDYLMKLEMDEEKLKASVEKALRKIQTKYRGGGYTKPADGIRKKSYFCDLLLSEQCPETDEQTRQFIWETFSHPILLLIHLHFPHDSYTEEFTRKDQNRIMAYAEDVLGEMVRNFFPENCLVRSSQAGMLLALSAPEDSQAQIRQNIRQMGQKLLTVIKDYFEVSAVIAVSRQGNSPEDLPELLCQVNSARNHSCYDSADPIVFYEDTFEEQQGRHSNFNINFLKKDLKKAIFQNDAQAFGQMMDQLIGLLGEKASRTQALNACAALYFFCESLFEERGGEQYPYVVNVVEELHSMKSREEVLCWMTWFRDQVCRILEAKREERKDQTVELAKQYIGLHYAEKITLSQVAQVLNITPSHLSSIFKKRTDTNFIDYVTQVRVEKAQELIKTHQYLMYEVAEKAGFDSPYYFSSVFKKITGYTPREYEKL